MFSPHLLVFLSLLWNPRVKIRDVSDDSSQWNSPCCFLHFPFSLTLIWTSFSVCVVSHHQRSIRRSCVQHIKLLSHEASTRTPSAWFMSDSADFRSVSSLFWGRMFGFRAAENMMSKSFHKITSRIKAELDLKEMFLDILGTTRRNFSCVATLWRIRKEKDVFEFIKWFVSKYLLPQESRITSRSEVSPQSVWCMLFI